MGRIACITLVSGGKIEGCQFGWIRSFHISKTEEVVKIGDLNWKKILSPEAYQVLREHATEPPYTGKYYRHQDKGEYYCAGCGSLLFSSESKFDSGSGWPSFYAAHPNSDIETCVDRSYGMTRTEIHCAKCGGHLGHLFADGPKPTGLRYCVNSAALNFRSKGDEEY